MKESRKLNEALEYIDDRYLTLAEEMEVSKKKYGRGMLWGWCVAACVCCVLIVAGSVTLPQKSAESVLDKQQMADSQDSAMPDNINIPGNIGEIENGPESAGATSDTYENLEELLVYLGEHGELHGEREQKDATGNDSVDNMQFIKARDVISYEGYVHRISDDGKVLIYKEGTSELVSEPDVDMARRAEELFLYRDRLVVIGSFEEGNELEPEYRSCIEIYSLENPSNPEMMDSYVQNGKQSACFMVAERLYLLTADGVCACEYSRMADINAYYPKLYHEGTEIPYQDFEISILGEPDRIQYVAATTLNIKLLEVEEKQAFYGNIESISYGSDWLAFVIACQNGERTVHSEVYTFDTEWGYVYTGKIGMTEPDSRIISISKFGDNYRMLGNVAVMENGQYVQENLMAITADLTKEMYQCQILDGMDYPYLMIDEILWEQNRAIVSIATMQVTESDIAHINRFVFVEFSGAEITFWENELRADHVAGIDMMYWYGSPFGQIQSLIPFGDGIYLRYNETPDGLDIYDFSDSANPVCVYRSEGEIPEGCRLDFENTVYDEEIFGIRMIKPDENGEYRNVSYSWRVYKVDPDEEQPFTLLSEVPVSPGVDYTIQR